MIPCGVVMVLGGFLLFAYGEHIASPEKLGEGTGRLALFALLCGLAVSYLAQTGRPRWAWGVAIGITLAFVLSTASIVWLALRKSDEREKATLTLAERAPLSEERAGGERWLIQRAAGFQFLNPGAGFQRAVELADAMTASTGADSPTHSWALRDDAVGTAVLISITKAAGRDEDELGRYLDGMARGLGSAIAGSKSTLGKPRVAERTVEWGDGEGEATLHIALGGLHIQVRALAYPVRGMARIVTITTMGPDPKELEAVRQSLRRR